MSDAAKICIIGPALETAYIGGVATHVRNLKTLPCLADADVLDPGSSHSSHSISVARVLGNILGLKRQLAAENYRHVLINSSIFLGSFLKLLLVLAALPGRAPSRVHVFFHGGRFANLGPLPGFLVKLAATPLLRKVDAFHFLSPVQLDGFQRIFGRATCDLYANYCPADDILPRERHATEELSLLFVGRVVREKGIYEAVAAVEKLVESGRRVRLTVVGDGPALPDLQRRCSKLPEGTVRFSGFLTGAHLDEAYRQADLLVLPTYHPEGFPYVFIEAMRSGVPAIVTPEGALETLVVDDVNGAQVVAKDVRSIVAALSRIQDTPGLLGRMSANCFGIFTASLSRTAAERYYRSLLESR